MIVYVKDVKQQWVVYLWTKEEGRDLEYMLPLTRYTAARKKELVKGGMTEYLGRPAKSLVTRYYQHVVLVRFLSVKYCASCSSSNADEAEVNRHGDDTYMHASRANISVRTLSLCT